MVSRAAVMKKFACKNSDSEIKFDDKYSFDVQ